MERTGNWAPLRSSDALKFSATGSASGSDLSQPISRTADSNVTAEHTGSHHETLKAVTNMLAVDADPRGWTIILTGFWNRAIFTPGWVIGRLTQSQKVDLEIQIESPELPIRVLFHNLVLTVTPSRLQINMSRCEDRLLQNAYRVAKGVLSDLIHTPVFAVDINFRFNCHDPAGKLLDASDIRDFSELADHGLAVERTVIRRHLRMSNETVNLMLEFQDGNVAIDFNFSRTTNNASEALKSLHEADPIALKNTATGILKGVYGAVVQLGDCDPFAQSF
jgi:hypothetical protein